MTLAAYVAAGQVYRGMPETEVIAILGEPRTEILRGGATVRTFTPNISMEFRGARVYSAVGLALQANAPDGRTFHLDQPTGVWMVDGERAPAAPRYVVDRSEPGRVLRTTEGRLILAQEERGERSPEVEEPPSAALERPEGVNPGPDLLANEVHPAEESLLQAVGKDAEKILRDDAMPQDGEFEDDPFATEPEDADQGDYDDWFAQWEEPEPLPLELEIAVAVGMEFFLSMIVARIAFGLFGFPVLWRQLAVLGLAMALTTFSLNGLVVWLEIPFVPPLLPELIQFFTMACFIYLFTDVTQGVTALQISLLCRIVITLLN
jgi:hypothetical protein